MKKLSKKLKSILIVSASVVCALAITLGCIFGLNKNNNNNNNNNNNGSGEAAAYEQFLQSQNSFANAIVLNNADEVLSSSDFSVLADANVTYANNGLYIRSTSSSFRDLCVKTSSGLAVVSSNYQKDITDEKGASDVKVNGDNILIVEQYIRHVTEVYAVLTVVSNNDDEIVYKAQVAIFDITINSNFKY